MNDAREENRSATGDGDQTGALSSGASGTSQRFYIAVFLASMCALILVAFYFSTNALNYRGDKAIRFDKMTDTEVIVSTGLSRTQTVYLKLGYIEQADTPDIAILGNHQVQYFSDEALGADAETLDFFNLWGAAATLNDNFAYAQLLENLGKLPKLLIIHVTTPNNDNGDVIVGHNPNMFAVLWQSGLVTSGGNILTIARNLFEGMRVRINETLDYISLVGAVSNRLGAVVIDREKCMTARTGSRDTRWWSRYVPNTLQHIFATRQELLDQFCQPKYIKSGFLNDGSFLPPTDHKPAIVNRNPLNPLRRKLTAEDAPVIAKTMKDIIALAERNGTKVVFLVPPVYETKRDSVVDQIFSKAIEDIPARYLIDDRYAGHGRPEIFLSYDHPNIIYYKEVVAKLRDRWLLPTK